MSEHLYSELADRFARSTGVAAANVVYDRPTVLDLAGDVADRDVLELGCAAGHLTEQLVARGARVVAVDRSEQMVALARERVGDRARIEVADLDRPLDVVDDDGVDVVVASLVLHYLPDWSGILAEVRRVLRPGGVLVFSVHHPITGWLRSDRSDYHRTELIEEDWTVDGLPVVAQMWRRPIEGVLMPLLDAGLVVDAVREPAPDLGEDDVPDDQTREILNHAPVFLFVRARRQMA